MPSPQINLRIALEHHDVLRAVAARLKSDAAFRDQLAALVAGVASPVAGVAGDSITARLESLEERVKALEAGTGQKAPQTVLEAAGEPLEAGEVLKLKPLEGVQEAPGGPQKRRRWTSEDDAVLRRVHAEGGIPEDASRELRRPSSVVSGKWKALGLPVQPRAGRKLVRRRM